MYPIGGKNANWLRLRDGGVEHTNNLVHLSNTKLLSNFEIQQ